MIIFLLILSILILVHELGHFVTAKRAGIKVEKFSLGFGPKLISKQIGETQYMICAIPFGGFIKMAGDSRDQFSGASYEFFSRSPGIRARIIFAGPFFNYILAFFCLWMVYYLGLPKLTAKVGDVITGMPAYAAGVREGDMVTEVDGKQIKYWDELTKSIHTKTGSVVRLKVLRESKELEFNLTPLAKEVDTVWGKKVEVGLVGIKPSDDIIKVRYGFWNALVKGTSSLINMTAMTIVAIFSIITGTISFKESVTGPLGIFFIATNAAKLGISAVLHVIGILSMSLAVFNLLPLPILDGGHIFLAGLEKLRKKALSSKVEDVISNIGMSFLVVLAVFIFFNDLIRYGYWDKFLALFGR